jgi:threonine dehydrogenase-like Zn-dependent dehydrogenase
MIYITYLESLKENIQNNFNSDILYIVYVKDILNISGDYVYQVVDLIKELKLQFEKILQNWFTIDDNKQYFEIMKDNRTTFTDDKNKADILKTII